MSFYVDTNVVMSFLLEDAHSSKVDDWLGKAPRAIFASFWLEAEFFALIGKKTRSGALTSDQSRVILDRFEAEFLTQGRRLGATASAGLIASSLARDASLKLSAADTLHLALSVDYGLTLLTFDARLADAAVARGHAVEVP